MDIALNKSWLNGKYGCGVINTSLGTIEVFDQEEGFFAQGEHAWEIIAEIHRNMDQRRFDYRTGFPRMDFIKLLIAKQSNILNLVIMDYLVIGPNGFAQMVDSVFNKNGKLKCEFCWIFFSS